MYDIFVFRNSHCIYLQYPITYTQFDHRHRFTQIRVMRAITILVFKMIASCCCCFFSVGLLLMLLFPIDFFFISFPLAERPNYTYIVFFKYEAEHARHVRVCNCVHALNIMCTTYGDSPF